MACTRSSARSRSSAVTRLSALVGALALGAVASAQTPAVLKADTQFPVIGTTLRLDLTGAPGAAFFLRAALAPSEFATTWGTVFLDVATMFEIDRGVLDATGSATLLLDVPNDPTLVGTFFYFEAGAKLASAKSVSNAVAVRVEAAVPSGTRHPAAIAATPDGAFAFVANEADGTLTVLDPAHDAVVREMPIGPPRTNLERSPRMALDPEGRHLFVVNPALSQLTVVHAASQSIAAQLPVPPACRDVAFKFTATSKRIFVANERDDTILVFTEAPLGKFTQTGVLPLKGHGPALLGLLPDGHLLVGQHHSLELEIIDPDDTDGDPLVTKVAMGSRALAFATLGSRVFISTFTPSLVVGTDGVNEVIEFDPATWTAVNHSFTNLATDYFGMAVSSQHLLVTGAGSGSLVVADPAALTTPTVVDLVPDESVKGLPRDVALIPPPGGGAPDRAYAIDRVRETVRPIRLANGPPFTLGAEIPLAHTGVAIHPLADLDAAGRGEFLFSSVLFFNGSPTLPNPVSCTTCHPNLFSDSITTARVRQCQPLFAISGLAPFGWAGDLADLTVFTQAAFKNHGKVGGKLNKLAQADVVAFQASITQSPASPFKNADGSISDAAKRGETIFNGVAGCVQCHAAPLWIPPSGSPLTIDAGVGTGLAPANVATLLGLWSSAPYLHDGSAPTLLDVLEKNVGDAHGTTSTLDAQQKADLVEFLKTL